MQRVQSEDRAIISLKAKTRSIFSFRRKNARSSIIRPRLELSPKRKVLQFRRTATLPKVRFQTGVKVNDKVWVELSYSVFFKTKIKLNLVVEMSSLRHVKNLSWSVKKTSPKSKVKSEARKGQNFELSVTALVLTCLRPKKAAVELRVLWHYDIYSELVLELRFWRSNRCIKIPNFVLLLTNQNRNRAGMTANMTSSHVTDDLTLESSVFSLFIHTCVKCRQTTLLSREGISMQREYWRLYLSIDCTKMNVFQYAQKQVKC